MGSQKRERLNGWWFKRNSGNKRSVGWEQQQALCGVDHFGKWDDVLNLVSNQHRQSQRLSKEGQLYTGDIAVVRTG